MNRRIISQLFFPVVYWAIALCGVYFIATTSYKEAVDFVSLSTGKTFSPDFLQRYLPERSFVIGRSVLSVVILLLSAAVFLYRKILYSSLKGLWYYCKDGWASLNHLLVCDWRAVGAWKYPLLLIPTGIFIFRVYLAANRPLQYDEAWSYNYHIGNNFAASFLLPNNHIFFTVVAFFFNKLPFSHEFAIRLPLLLSSAAAAVLMYYFLRQFFSQKLSWMGALFFYSSCPVTFYSFYARGYIFAILFAIIFLIASYKWLISNCSRYQPLLLLSLAFVLSVYSVPTILYLFAPAFLVLFVATFRIRKQKVGQLFFYSFMAMVVVFILYAPSWFSEHGASLANTTKGSSLVDRNFLRIYFLGNEHFQLGIDVFNGILHAVIILALAVFAFYFRGKLSFLTWICLLGLTLPFILSSIQGKLLAERFLVHFIIYFSIFYGIVHHLISKALPVHFLKRLSKWSLLFGYSVVLATANLSAAMQHYFFNWSLKPDRSIKAIATTMKKENIDSVYILAMYTKPGIEYYYKIDKRAITILMPYSSSINYAPFDSTKMYPSLLLETGMPTTVATERYKPIYKDENYTLMVPITFNSSIQQ